MTDSKANLRRELRAGVQALRIVLFGMPDSGKTSLLSALLEAAETQEHVLNGQLTDLSGELAELRVRFHQGNAQPTSEEIVLYPVHFEPRAGGGREFRGGLDALLIDCSGLVANELLFRQEPLDGKSAEGVLANSILVADTVFLVVDASGGATELESDFGQLARFLQLLERSRGRRTDISGLPVFLVLSKCDLLAQSGDAAGAWVERIEGRKSEVATRFREFLDRHRGKNGSAFGRIDLHVWATAIKRPTLAGAADKPRGPFGVAELFRQGLASAQSFRRRQGRATRKLARTIGAVVGALGILCAFALLLILGFWEPSRLEVRIERFGVRQRAQPPRERLIKPQAKIDELLAFQNDASFADLPVEKRNYVRDQLAELHAYQAYDQELREITDPRDASSLAQLDDIERDLKKLPVPSEYKVEWSQSEAGRRSAEWLEDIAAIREAVQKVDRWYQKLIQDGRHVLDDLSGPNLPGRAKKVLQEAAMPPFPESDKDQRLPGSRVSYDTVFRITSVAETRRKWEEEIKKKLEPYARFPNP
jgi:GTPase SAR1 family protein